MLGAAQDSFTVRGPRSEAAPPLLLLVTGADDSKLLVEGRESAFSVDCEAAVSYAPGFTSVASAAAAVLNKKLPHVVALAAVTAVQGSGAAAASSTSSSSSSSSSSVVRSSDLLRFTALRPFDAAVRLSFGLGAGAQAAQNLSLSADRMTLFATAPRVADVCAGIAGIAGCYVRYTLSQPSPSLNGTTRWASITCPGDYCAGDPLRYEYAHGGGDAPGNNYNWTTAAEREEAGGRQWQPNGGEEQQEEQQGLAGPLFFSDPCLAFALDGTQQCIDVDFADQCAFRVCSGQGCACQKCPEGAFCPSGSRLWPQPGYWAASEQSGVQKCAQPLTRCAGYNGTGRGFRDPAALCGAGYNGTLCSVCAASFWKDGRLCRRCNSEGSAAKQRNHIIALGLFAGFVVVVVYFLVKIAKRVQALGSTVRLRTYTCFLLLLLTHD